MSEKLLHPTMEPIGIVLDGMLEAAVYASRQALLRKNRKLPRKHSTKGLTLRPSDRTPLWNELRERLRNQTWKHGEKAKLARRLGLPRQRISEFLSSGSMMPDAERTLWLLLWLQARENGKEIPL
jgi:transcriptional regulator with XRE-family HTH domain